MSDYGQTPPRKSGGNDTPSLGYWIAAAILMCTGWGAPIGVMMLVFGIVKIIDQNKNTPNRYRRHPYDLQQDASQGAPTASAGQAQAAPQASPSARQRKAAQKAQAQAEQTPPPRGNGTVPIPVPRNTKVLNTLGGILAGIGGFTALSTFVSEVAWSMPLSLLQDCLPFLCILFAGLALLAYTARRGKKYRRFCRYLTLIGKEDSVSLTALAGACGYSHQKVCADLQEMLEKGYLAGYFDLSNDKLLLTSEGLKDEEPEEKKAADAQPAGDPSRDPEAILGAIRSINDAIAQPELTAKIDQIEDLTRKIFDYIKLHPQKAPQIRSFLNYYLPTTVKILNSYAQLESQGVQGENVAASKARVEGMIDQVVSGFQRQLELLVQDDVMDLDSEIKVMEQMLQKDGLSQSDSVSTSGGTTLSI